MSESLECQIQDGTTIVGSVERVERDRHGHVTITCSDGTIHFAPASSTVSVRRVQIPDAVSPAAESPMEATPVKIEAGKNGKGGK